MKNQIKRKEVNTFGKTEKGDSFKGKGKNIKNIQTQVIENLAQSLQRDTEAIFFKYGPT